MTIKMVGRRADDLLVVFGFGRQRIREDLDVDRVTGVFTRRHLDDVIARGSDGAIADGDDGTVAHEHDGAGATASTMMVELDGFASINGQPTREQVLERVAWLITATARTTDIVFRRTAESFCVLLPGTPERDAIALAERVRLNVDQMPLLATSHVEVSIGVSTGTFDDLANTIDRAENARVARLVSAASVVASVAVRNELADIFAALSRPHPHERPVSMLPPASTPFAPPVV